jgi:ethanolamine ammonia-lyase small subunit
MAAPESGPEGADARLAPRDGPGPDPWHALASSTPARIALGRAGGSLRTESLLELRLAHARARDAVAAPLDVPALEEALRSQGLETARLATCARDLQAYLARPDLGRALDPESAALLRSMAEALGPRDLAVLVSGGLSATAAASHAARTLGELARILAGERWTLYPVFVVPFARVKLQDAVGALLGAGHSLILLGERPGLSAPDSLGAYLTYGPRADRTDADRNCVSNIRADGLSPPDAALRLARLLSESRRLGLSGSALRVDGALPEAAPGLGR